MGFKLPQRSKNRFSGGGQSGIGTLMGYMVGQQKGQEGQKQLPEGVPVERIDPSGTKYKSENSRFFTADAQNQLSRIKQLTSVVRGVQELGNTLPTDPIRAFAGSIGAEKLYGRFGTSQHKTYLDTVPAASAGAYRAVTGDNRLSDEDAASRAKPLFWDPREPEDTREGKNAFLNFMLEEAENGLTYQNEPKDDMESMIRWQNYVKKSKQKFEKFQGSDVSNDNNVSDENFEPSQTNEDINLEEEILNRLKGSF